MPLLVCNLKPPTLFGIPTISVSLPCRGRNTDPGVSRRAPLTFAAPNSNRPAPAQSRLQFSGRSQAPSDPSRGPSRDSSRDPSRDPFRRPLDPSWDPPDDGDGGSADDDPSGDWRDPPAGHNPWGVSRGVSRGQDPGPSRGDRGPSGGLWAAEGGSGADPLEEPGEREWWMRLPDFVPVNELKRQGHRNPR